jgi:hypothetical protein
MSSEKKGLVRRLVSGLVGLLPNGGIGDEGPAPDVDGKRDTDTAYRQSVLRVKSQMSSGGQATTSYEPVDRGSLGD